jgi:hypothetical protein
MPYPAVGKGFIDSFMEITATLRWVKCRRELEGNEEFIPIVFSAFQCSPHTERQMP